MFGLNKIKYTFIRILILYYQYPEHKKGVIKTTPFSKFISIIDILQRMEEQL